MHIIYKITKNKESAIISITIIGIFKNRVKAIEQYRKFAKENDCIYKEYKTQVCFDSVVTDFQD